jgi:putative ABC transport system substrate-binding protein
VIVAVGDPVGLGLATSLARPGGNVTGLASYLPELGAKPLEVLKETIPDATRVVRFWNPTNPLHRPSSEGLTKAALSLAIEVQSLIRRIGTISATSVGAPTPVRLPA